MILIVSAAGLPLAGQDRLSVSLAAGDHDPLRPTMSRERHIKNRLAAMRFPRSLNQN